MKIVENALPLGTVLDSGQHQYRIVKVLGQGGFGITYQAVAKIKVGNVQVDVPFAVKEHFISSFCGRQGASVTIPNPSNVQEVNDSLNSFLTEAERLNRLSLEHDGLVKVNESFQANGTAYYVMEYIGGENLRQYVKRQPAGRLSETEALPIIRKVADAVGYLHRSQVTHLDIKPDNILLREDGTPVLIDFGLAKHYDKKGKATSTLKVAGCSDGYSPLEQYAGIDHFSPQADVYALAATLLYMLTGKDPRKASEITSGQIEQSLPSEVSVTTRTAIIHAMQLLTANRTASVSQFSSDLSADDYTEEVGLTDERDEGAVTVKRKEERGFQWSKKIVMYTAASAIALLLVIVVVVALSNSNDGESVYVGASTLDKELEPDSEYLSEQSETDTEDEQEQHRIRKKAIDLGLPSGTLWANCNLGAISSEQDDGNHYAFGTIVSKENYPENTGDQYRDGESIIGTSADVVRIKWGDDWQLPSKDQFKELIDNCKFVVESGGYRVIGPNGNRMFLPYTRGNGSIGYYWSGNKGVVLEFQPGGAELNSYDYPELVNNFATYCGLSIRAVRSY